MRSIPPLNALRAFEAAARTGSFKEAALELHVSQSAVSHQIKHLEKVLGVKLFDRGTRAVVLTEAGRTYLPFLQQAFDSISDGTRLLTRVTREDILTVRMYSTFAVRWLISRLHRFQDQHPDLQVRLMTSQLDTAFPDQDVDLAVMIGRPRPGRVHYEYLFSPTMFPVCSPKLITARKRIKRPSDLAGFTILQVYPSAEDWAAWLKATRRKGRRSRFRPAIRQLRSCAANGGARHGRCTRHAALRQRGFGRRFACRSAATVTRCRHRAIGISCIWRNTQKLRKIAAFQAWLLEEIDADESLAALRPKDSRN